MKKSMALEKLVDVYQITEWKNGCVFKTQFIEQKWIDIDAKNPEGYLYVVPTLSDDELGFRSKC